MELRSRVVSPRTTQTDNNSRQEDATNTGQQLTPIIATPTLATQVNPFHNSIDLIAVEGKKLYKKATTSLPEYQRHDGDPNAT